ncbi:ABC transporter permease subunit [Ferrimonas gelatinilytica]|uniref:ABC transporter permease n=1 Tax=Ferrimonas gelatinilytica TaxID=1255257 RepID=A0ABP9RTW1_9GAMM
MLIYLLRRLNLLVLTALVLLGLLYIASLKMPGDTLTNLSGVTHPSQEQVARLTERYHLDGNGLQGYLAFVRQRLTGDFGLSQASGRPVLNELLQVIPATLELTILALLLALLVGIPLGVLAAGRRGPLPNLLWGGTLLGFSVPTFWLGLLLMLTFGLSLDALPASGRINLLYDVPFVTGFMLVDILLSDAPWRWAALWDAINHLVLPTLVLAALPCFIVIRTIRAAMLAEMDKNYIRALMARGVPRYRLVLSHALPNSLAPMLRLLSLQLGQIASGVIIVEMIFTWPGIGSWLLAAQYQGDHTALTGGVLVVALSIIVLTILLEIAQALLNPVIRKEIHG